MKPEEKTVPERQTVKRAVQMLYNADPDREWERMDRHRMEFAVTLPALEAYLPPLDDVPVRVLDCGGGPGRYAIELSQRGYAVTLFDLSSELLVMAQEQAKEAGVMLDAVEQGTAVDLSRFSDGSFDAVLLMGPLYHLLEESERRQALAEAYRVVKPGGAVFAAFISRYAGHRYAAANDPAMPLSYPELYRRLLETGCQLPGPDVRFVAYFAHPSEVEPLCRQVGLDVETVLGVEGLVSIIEEKVNELSGSAWEYWVGLCRAVAPDPSIHGCVEHLLAVCRKPHWRGVLRGLAARLAESGIAYRVVGGTALALRGLSVPVHDLDVEMSVEDVYRFGELFSQYAVEPVAWRESPEVRSHIGRFEIEGVMVEAMGGLERRRGDRWLPSMLMTEASVELDGVPVAVLELEEEALAYLRRGRLERAALALRQCDPQRFQALLDAAVAGGLF